MALQETEIDELFAFEVDFSAPTGLVGLASYLFV
jgi:hypothetical protein